MSTALAEKVQTLETLVRGMDSVLVAFSGGIDSTVVLAVAHRCLGFRAVGVTAVSPTFPAIELEHSKRLVEEIGARHLIVDTDQLRMPGFAKNEADRCYYCKTDLYQRLGTLKEELGVHAVADGTHVDDLGDDRPGLRAAREWGVRSPLVEAGLSKADVRTLAKDLGLSNWDKPAAACLSSRIPHGTPITLLKLSRVEKAEAALLQEGFRQFRVRDHGEVARIELDEAGLSLIEKTEVRERIVSHVKAAGFRFVTVDLEGYRPGGASRRAAGR